MGPKTKRLIQVLEELMEVLEDLEHGHWADWMCETRRRLLNSDGSGVLYLLGAYGGMGSFNDLRLEGDDGTRVAELRAEAYRLAEDIRVELRLA